MSQRRQRGPGHRLRFPRRAGALVAAALLVTALAACGGTDEEPANPLPQDPMASWLPDNLEVVSERTGDEQRTTLTGKPIYDTVTRVFRVVEGSSQDALAEAATAAEAAGWTARFERSSGWTGEKSIDGETGVLTLALSTVGGEEQLFLKMSMP